jgi:hypothetical protein
MNNKIGLKLKAVAAGFAFMIVIVAFVFTLSSLSTTSVQSEGIARRVTWVV